MSTLTQPTVSDDWWRHGPPPDAARVTRGALAFRLLVAFTVVLLVSPQSIFPVLAPLRIALLTAGLAIVAHLFSRLMDARDIIVAGRGTVIALVLAVWA